MNRFGPTVASLPCVALLAAGVFLAAPARGADDRYSLESDVPTRLQDAFPLEPGEAIFKLVSQYERADDGADVTLVQPEIAAGIAPRVDLHLLVPVLIGEGDRQGSGDIGLTVQALVLEEREGDRWPSIAIEAGLAAPTGRGTDGFDTELQLVATKTLTWSPAYDAVHANLVWSHNFERDREAERADGYSVILGYTRRIAPDTVLVLDAVWERSFDKGQESELAEVGLIRSLGEHVDLAAGVGIGLGDDAPDFTATLAIVIAK